MDAKDYGLKKHTEDELVILTAETIGNNPSPRSLSAQAELTRRLMESIKKLDESSSKYSDKILILSVVLLLVAIEQLVFSIFPISLDGWKRYLLGILALGVVAYVFWDLTKRRK